MVRLDIYAGAFARNEVRPLPLMVGLCYCLLLHLQETRFVSCLQVRLDTFLFLAAAFARNKVWPFCLLSDSLKRILLWTVALSHIFIIIFKTASPDPVRYMAYCL